MKLALLLAASVLSFSAMAHVEPGPYKGLDQNGKVCSFTIGDMYFENDMRHPLTERLRVSEIVFVERNTADAVWSLGHPPVVNTEVGSNRYNHDIFQQIVPTKTGATSVTVLKGPEESEDGKPVGIIYIEDNYKNAAESKKLTCLL